MQGAVYRRTCQREVGDGAGWLVMRHPFQGEGRVAVLPDRALSGYPECGHIMKLAQYLGQCAALHQGAGMRYVSS